MTTGKFNPLKVSVDVRCYWCVQIAESVRQMFRAERVWPVLRIGLKSSHLSAEPLRNAVV